MKIDLHSGNASGAALPVRSEVTPYRRCHPKYHLQRWKLRLAVMGCCGGCLFTCEVAVFPGKKTITLRGFSSVCVGMLVVRHFWPTDRLIILSVFIRWIGESRIRSKFLQNTDLPFFLICFLKIKRLSIMQVHWCDTYENLSISQEFLHKRLVGHSAHTSLLSPAFF